jgi:hypothetical protein
LTAGEAKNVDNAIVLARLFNEASGQKAPSKKHGLFISRPLQVSWPVNFLYILRSRQKKSSEIGPMKLWWQHVQRLHHLRSQATRSSNSVTQKRSNS